MPRVHHSRLGTRQAGDIRRIAIFLLGINPPVACQMKKKKKRGWESPIEIGKVSSLMLSRLSLSSLEDNRCP